MTKSVPNPDPWWWSCGGGGGDDDDTDPDDDDDGGDIKTGKVDPFSKKRRDEIIEQIIRESTHPNSRRIPTRRTNIPISTRITTPHVAKEHDTVKNRINALKNRFAHVNPIDNAVIDVRTTNPIAMRNQERNYNKIRKNITDLISLYERNPESVTNRNIDRIHDRISAYTGVNESINVDEPYYK